MATTVTLKPNAIDISGSTSGTTTLQATAVAGTTTITLPAATDTLVGKATTDTLTNKTLTTPTINQFSSASATNLTIQSAGTTAVTIDTSQNVGIGTASPAVKLEVKASSGAGEIRVDSSAGDILQLQSSATESRIGSISAVPLTFRTSNTEAMRIDSSGNVGIGTTSPSTYANSYAPVLVTGTGNNFATIQARSDGPSGYGNGVSYGGSYSTNPINGARMWIGAAGGAGQRGGILFYTKDLDDNTTQPLERMRIDSSGNLNIASSASNGAYVNIWCGDNIRNGLNVQVFSNGNNAVGFKNVSGTQVGGITVNASTTAYNTSSDYRLKNSITPMTGALAKVQSLKPVTYKWNLDNTESEGFIAHELAEVCPHAVTGAKDAVDADGNPVYQGIDVSFLVATLTAALQETKALIDTQAETINALTARVVALESK